jgi:hypothetical protein
MGMSDLYGPANERESIATMFSFAGHLVVVFFLASRRRCRCLVRQLRLLHSSGNVDRCTCIAWPKLRSTGADVSQGRTPMRSIRSNRASP